MSARASASIACLAAPKEGSATWRAYRSRSAPVRESPAAMLSHVRRCAGRSRAGAAPVVPSWRKASAGDGDVPPDDARSAASSARSAAFSARSACTSPSFDIVRVAASPTGASRVVASRARDTGPSSAFRYWLPHVPVETSARRGVEIFIRREFGEASDIEYQLATHVEARGGVAGPLEMKGGVRVKRASVRRCSSTLLMLGMASPLLFVLGTGRMRWNRRIRARRAGARVDRAPRGGDAGVAARAVRGTDPHVGGADRARDGHRAREPSRARRARRDLARGRASDRRGGAADGRGAEMASVDSDSDSGADSDADAADPDFYDDDTGPKTGMSDEQCEVLANDWIASRDELLAKRMASGKSDMLFFLHVPRTAGRTYHFCYLKLAYPEARRCARSYDALRVNVDDPKCEFLASHDDYSLVERFHQQPKVVTMLRDPVLGFSARTKFAVEVSVRSFGQEIKVSSSRVATRDVWPWSDAVRYIDKQLKDYKQHVEGNGKKDSIVNVYNNSVYTPCTCSPTPKRPTTISTTVSSCSSSA